MNPTSEIYIFGVLTRLFFSLFGLNSFLHLVNIIVENISESAPRLFWDGDGCPEVGLDLADSHVDAPVVLADIKIEVLILNPAVTAFWQLALEPTILSAELLDKVSQGVPELDHALGRNGYLGPWASPSNSLRHSQKP